MRPQHAVGKWQKPNPPHPHRHFLRSIKPLRQRLDPHFVDGVTTSTTLQLRHHFVDGDQLAMERSQQQQQQSPTLLPPPPASPSSSSSSVSWPSFSLDGDERRVAVGVAAAASAHAQQAGLNDVVVVDLTRGHSTTPADEGELKAVISALQEDRLIFIPGTRPPPSVQGQQANHAVPRQTKRVSSIVGNCWTAVKVHCAPDDQVEELQKRCCTYSLRAFGFQICTLIGAAAAAPVIKSSPTGNMAPLIVAMAGLVINMMIDVVSFKMKPQWGRGLVYLSSSFLMLNTFLLFISMDIRYGYGMLSVPVLICAIIVHHKLWPAPEVRDDEAIQEKLDGIFDLWAGILNVGAFIGMMFTFIMQAKHSSASVTGFLLMLNIIFGLYQVIATTAARPAVPLTRFTTYLDWFLLALLVLGTLTSIVVGTVIKLLS